MSASLFSTADIDFVSSCLESCGLCNGSIGANQQQQNSSACNHHFTSDQSVDICKWSAGGIASLPPPPMYMFTLYQLVKFRIYLLTYMYLKPIYALRQMLSVQLELSFSRGVCGGVGGQFCPTLIDNSFFKQTGSPCIYWQFQVRKQSFHEDI